MSDEYRYNYSGRDYAQDTDLDKAAGVCKGTLDQCKTQCDQTPGCVGIVRYIQSDYASQYLKDDSNIATTLLKQPFTITNEINDPANPSVMVPNGAYKIYSKVEALGTCTCTHTRTSAFNELCTGNASSNLRRNKAVPGNNKNLPDKYRNHVNLHYGGCYI